MVLKAITLTHVCYQRGDMLGLLLAWISLVPVFISLSGFFSHFIFHHELQAIFFALGLTISQFLNELSLLPPILLPPSLLLPLPPPSFPSSASASSLLPFLPPPSFSCKGDHISSVGAYPIGSHSNPDLQAWDHNDDVSSVSPYKAAAAAGRRAAVHNLLERVSDGMNEQMMASKVGYAGGIPERRVRPIWDAVDSRQYKNALKLATALLTKYPNSPYALAKRGQGLLNQF
ncbi:Lipid phosphate phosphatase gamma [Nymphaea thermarum]|nr:Lipid phosphate phosphatase gamma [Nymphaea thermarum]